MPSLFGDSDAERVDPPHFTERDIAQLSDRRDTVFPLSVEGMEEVNAAKDALAQHGEDVHEAREAQRATGYKVRWSIGWRQLMGWLIFAAIVGGVMLLSLHHFAAPAR
jgi:hypothetical protein